MEMNRAKKIIETERLILCEYTTEAFAAPDEIPHAPETQQARIA